MAVCHPSYVFLILYSIECFDLCLTATTVSRKKPLPWPILLPSSARLAHRPFASQYLFLPTIFISTSNTLKALFSSLTHIFIPITLTCAFLANFLSLQVLRHEKNEDPASTTSLLEENHTSQLFVFGKSRHPGLLHDRMRYVDRS